jgi:hypothetical protein
LAERRWHSSGERCLRGIFCGNDCYVVVKKVMEILSGYKRKTQKFDVDRFDLQRPLIWKLKNSIRFISEEGLRL